jgi:hypothetical protein
MIERFQAEVEKRDLRNFLRYEIRPLLSMFFVKQNCPGEENFVSARRRRLKFVVIFY